jgi:uncharacterized protein (DUF2267 family)
MSSWGGTASRGPIVCSGLSCRPSGIGCPPTRRPTSPPNLPTLLRGVYYEHWRPATTPVKQRERTAFLARISQAFVDDPSVYPPEATSLAFEFLSRKLSGGEIDDVRRALPADLRALWPAPARVV